MSESTIAAAVLDEVRQRGGWIVKTTGVTLAGCPDTLGSYRGRALAWEIKKPGGQPTPRQTFQLERAAAAGADAAVIRSRSDARARLEAIDGELAMKTRNGVVADGAAA